MGILSSLFGGSVNQLKGDRSDIHIFGCFGCGRLNYRMTDLCIHCGWAPKSVHELARSASLGTPTQTVSNLLIFAREVANGASPKDVVLNLEDVTNDNLKSLPGIEMMFKKSQECVYKRGRIINKLRKCKSCNKFIIRSTLDKCKCGQSLDWNQSERALICIDIILWLFEQKIMPPENADDFSHFVGYLVMLSDELLRKHRVITKKDKEVLTYFLTHINFIDNAGAIYLKIEDLDKVVVNLVKDRAQEDSEFIALYMQEEFEHLAKIIQ